ncbi:nucleoporin protein Ndc1-Nup-domain-containing protein [Pisolithus orientalis]|uniref:nucleoporin protein Ndc1-Nup-domain-containing protein n=1 Tax=Pisolithus orientalis TaxID=936130 RepID=UPI0022243851|nr:nucleoporin protein Ndc1-Nup-domain-containing protein [Pisolithus orientalis]KAI5989819.1 nucleoporin protein Ndc1-Nup-domain-containing protein [Pisolithus orientalis]
MSTSFTSSFSARPSPTVPPASQSYEPLVKAVLKHRLNRNIFAFSAAFSLGFHILFWSSDDSSLSARLLSLSAWLVASLAWLVGVLPIIVSRKLNLTTHSTVAPSPRGTLAGALSKSSTCRILTVYTASALLLLSLHLYSEPAIRESLNMSVFVKSRKHPHYLNGSFIFLVTAQAWFALSFFLRNIMLERFVFRWSRNAPSNPPNVFINFPLLLVTIGLFTLVTFTAYNVVFGIMRVFVLPILLRIPLMRSLLRPFVAHFIRGPWTLILPLRHLRLEFRTFLLGLITLANWEFAETLFNLHIPQPIDVSHTTAEPNVTLISGVTSTDLVFLHFAYSELRNLATDSSPSSSTRRIVLFSDQNTLARAALLRLGNPAPPSPPPPVAAPATRQKEVAKEVETLAKDVHVPELFRSVTAYATSAVPASSAAISVAQNPPTSPSSLITSIKQGCCGHLVKYAPPRSREICTQLNEWLARERIHKRAEMSLPNRELDALVIESLSALVCASLTEDRYGVEAFLSLLQAAEDYQNEVRVLYVPPTPEELTRVEVAKASEAISVVGDALKSGISDIVRTFGDKLTAFKFPPKTARKLQSFVDYI